MAKSTIGIEAALLVAMRAACLCLPVALLHARAAAEAMIAVVDVGFLARRALRLEGTWPREAFPRAALVWWAWLVIASVAHGGLLPGLLAIRLPVLAIALRREVLQARWLRDALWGLLAAAFLWIALESWEQWLTGFNSFGRPAFFDGALTGPFAKPRAGPALILLFFPVVLPAVAWAVARPEWWGRPSAGLLAAAAVATQILIGQRMPALLMGLGLGVSALLLKKLRIVLASAVFAGCVVLAALPVVSPATEGKLVLRFETQMAHFSASPYGRLFAHAAALAKAHPISGLGFDGFRRDCAAMRAREVVAPIADGADGCSIHPHNYYLEAAVDAGLPGLAAFCWMTVAGLLAVGWGGSVRQTGLFVGAVVALWPLASSSAFTSMPNGGWVFLLLGFGMAENRPGKTPVATRGRMP